MPDATLLNGSIAAVATTLAPLTRAPAPPANVRAFFDAPMLNEVATLAMGAGLNLLVAVAIIRFIYFPVTRNRQYIFSFLAFNTVIFFVLVLLTSVQLSVGVGFGLFAIFSVLRYRTDEIPIRETTYLFVLIALPVMNSVILNGGNLWRVLFANATVIAVLFVLERGWGFRYQGRKKIVYERVDLITPDRRADLLADLQARTGLAVRRVEVGAVDFVRDTAELVIFYDENAAKPAG